MIYDDRKKNNNDNYNNFYYCHSEASWNRFITSDKQSNLIHKNHIQKKLMNKNDDIRENNPKLL